MRALVFTGPGEVRWQDVPEPALPPDGVLVRPLAVARCDLDAPMVRGALFPGPFVVGHELVGEVVAVGPEVRHRRTGERVMVPFQVSCGSCDACRAGRTSTCRTYRAPAGAAYGLGPQAGGHGGAVAELLAAPHADHLLVPAPPGVAATLLATLPDNCLDGWRSVGPPLAAEAGADVLVVGSFAPSVGSYAVAAAVASGASRVRFVNADPARLALAEALGAEAVEHAGAWPRRFDQARITVENTGTPEGLATTLRSTDDDGTCRGVSSNSNGLSTVAGAAVITACLLAASDRGQPWGGGAGGRPGGAR